MMDGQRRLVAKRLFSISALVTALVAAPAAHAGSTITIVNNDGAGEGFNDPGPADPDSTTGGNTGGTLGAQRLMAFQFAADIWASRVDSTVEIPVDAEMNPLFCDLVSAVLGQAGAGSVHRDFMGAPLGNTWYPQALANSLAETDLNAASDVDATFNSDIGTDPLCGFDWYYGLDANPPGGKIDFVTVVLHEIAHGLGFQTYVDLLTGAKMGGFDDVYMLNLEDHSTAKLYPDMTNLERILASTDTGDLHWVGSNVVAGGVALTGGVHPGGHVEMYAPLPQELGSSVSHFSTTLTPDEVMEPSHTGVLHDPSLAAALMTDIGWPCSSTLDLTINQWTLISLPCNPSPADTVADVFGDDLSGVYDVNWVVYERDEANDVYVKKALTDPLSVGRGYWIKTNQASQTVDVEGKDYPVTAVSLDAVGTDGTGCASSAGRCNMMGELHKYDVCWADVQVIDGASTLSLAGADPMDACQGMDAVANGCIMSRVAHKWTGSSYAPFDGTTLGMEGTLVAWDGFWVSAAKPGIELRVPATAGNCGAPGAGFTAAGSSSAVVENTLQGSSSTAASGDQGDPQKGWYIRLIAESGALRDSTNVLGQLPDSVNGYDSHDLIELSPFGSDFLTIVFPHLNWQQPGNYASDFHRLQRHGTRDRWHFEVHSSKETALVTLVWEGPDQKLAHSTLVDRDTKERIEIVPGGAYSFTLNDGVRRFSWIIKEKRAARKQK